MELLITTPKYIFTFNAMTGHIKLVRGGDGEYYGVSWSKNGPCISHSLIDCEQLKTWEDYQKSKGGNISFATKKRTYRTKSVLLQPHQIECVNGLILATNTGRNCLSIFQFDGNLIRDIYFNDIKWDVNSGGKTGNHYNSVHKVKENIYLVAHNHGRRSSVYHFSWPHFELQRIISTDAEWAHNLWPCEHGFLICNSKHGSLYDIESGQTVWKATEKPIFTRGLAATEDYIFVGRSELGKRKDRTCNTGGVWVLDRHSLKTLDVFKFPGSGCVNEVRLISGVDDCHNGVAFKPEWISRIKDISIRNRCTYYKKRFL